MNYRKPPYRERARTITFWLAASKKILPIVPLQLLLRKPCPFGLIWVEFKKNKMLLLAHSNFDPSMNYEWLTGRCWGFLVGCSIPGAHQTSPPQSYILVPRFALSPFKISLNIPIYHLSAKYLVHSFYHILWSTKWFTLLGKQGSH